VTTGAECATDELRTLFLFESLSEELFLLQTCGDDRAVAETYVAGQALKSALPN